MQRLCLATLVAGLASLLVLAGAQAGPVALALVIEGESEPPIEPFSELEAGNSISLGDKTRIEFLHYNTCQTIVVVGGRISFTEQQFLVQRGEVVDVSRSPCPKMATLKKDSSVGGVLLRSGDGLRLKSRPSFVLVGARRASFEKLRILKGEREVLEAEIEEYRFEWPSDQDPLAPGKDYVIELRTKSNDETLRLKFQVTSGRGKSPLTVVRID